MMFRSASLAAIGAGALCVLTTAASAQSTTRIETRPIYGAVITVEHGVRVIRPLPPDRHVIINPSDTPLSLNFNDTRVYERRTIRHDYSNNVEGRRVPRSYGGGYYLGAPGFFERGGRHFGPHRGPAGEGPRGGGAGGIR